MKRRSFIATAGLTAISPMISRPVFFVEKIPAHNWDGYDFGPAPSIKKRLNQGPFSSYGPGASAPGAEVVMTTQTALGKIPNPGMGLVTYICDEMGPPRVERQDLHTTIEQLARFPLGDILYLRVDWRDIQKVPGKLEFPEHWEFTFKMAEKYGKRVAFRIQLMSPVIKGHSVPGFLVDQIPFVKLGTTSEIGLPGKVHYAPRYDHPAFMHAFKELDDLLSEKYNGHPLVEYVDTFMYGFWGEGHTWPFEGNPFPDYTTAERTSIEMFEHQAANWTKTPLTTNTQPDYSNVGNSEVLDRTVRSHNWLRTDTIFIEPEQIDALSNRPPWIGATIEQGMAIISDSMVKEAAAKNKNIIAHVSDVSPTYFSLWNWHHISAQNLNSYYSLYPEPLDELATSIGYRIRPSWIWYFENEGYPHLLLGIVNDGMAGIPGALRLTIANRDGSFIQSGSLDPGYPLPGKVRQALFSLPKNLSWEECSLRAEIEIKGVFHAVTWACNEKLEDNGALFLKRNL